MPTDLKSSATPLGLCIAIALLFGLAWIVEDWALACYVLIAVLVVPLARTLQTRGKGLNISSRQRKEEAQDLDRKEREAKQAHFLKAAEDKSKPR